MEEHPSHDSVASSRATTSSEPTDARKIGYGTVLRRRDARVLAISRATSKMAMSTISYGAMVHLGQVGASQLQISLVSSSSYLAALLFGAQGGIVADTVSKRLAIAAGHGALAAMCFLIPSLLGTGAGDLMLLMFLSSMIMQVVSPGLKAAVALVASPDELAVTSALVSVVGSIASGIGSAFLAPIVIKFSGINAVLYLGGVIYVIGAIRALAVPRESRGPAAGAMRQIDWKPRALSLRATAGWILRSRAVATMILSGAIVVAMFEAFNTLVPLYVKDVLNTDPANSVYIFAPAGLGFLVGTFLAPPLIRRVGERRVALISLACMSVSMVLFGIIDLVAPLFAIVSPLRLLELAGITLSDEVLAASVIAIPLNLGSTMSGAAVVNFINRRVPVVTQGATFGLQEVQENALVLVSVLSLGAIASVTGPQVVMITAPIVSSATVVILLRYSVHSSGDRRVKRWEALEMLSTDAEDGR